jgi:hypothetical protein
VYKTFVTHAEWVKGTQVFLKGVLAFVLAQSVVNSSLSPSVKNVFWGAFLVQGLNRLQVEARKDTKKVNADMT